MLLNFGVKQDPSYNCNTKLFNSKNKIPEIEMNFDYVLCRKCMQNLRGATGAALTLASAPAIVIAERNERVRNLSKEFEECVQ